jgi:hypothetical protein
MKVDFTLFLIVFLVAAIVGWELAKSCSPKRPWRLVQNRLGKNRKEKDPVSSFEKASTPIFI